MSANASALRLTLTMCVTETLSMTGFAAYKTLLPQLMREWGLNNSEAGAISGILFAGYMVGVPVLTSLTDRVDSRRVYLAACLISTVGAGGNQSELEWGFAFASIGIFGALAPLGRWMYVKRGRPAVGVSPCPGCRGRATPRRTLSVLPVRFR